MPCGRCDAGTYVKAGWHLKALFWTAIFASAVCLAVVSASVAGGFRLYLLGSFGPPERGLLETLTILVWTALPLTGLFLIVRAIRRRDTERPRQTIIRALYPLAALPLAFFCMKAFDYLDLQSFLRQLERWRSGSVSYLCSEFSPGPGSQTGRTKLKLAEQRHPGAQSTWTVFWPEQAPIKATSFQVDLGSIGGSQGIKWREPGGQAMTAYLSFSDIIVGQGASADITVNVFEGDIAENARNLDARNAQGFGCVPDKSSYRDGPAPS